MNRQELINTALRKGLNRDRTRRRRNQLIKEFLNAYSNDFKYFFTFTFNDEHYPINKSSFSKYLKRQGINYILFLDAGKSETERLHYHGFIVSKVKLSGDKFNLYGFTHYSEIQNVGSHSTMSRMYYVSQKNFNEKLDRVLTCRSNKW